MRTIPVTYTVSKKVNTDVPVSEEVYQAWLRDNLYSALHEDLELLANQFDIVDEKLAKDVANYENHSLQIINKNGDTMLEY